MRKSFEFISCQFISNLYDAGAKQMELIIKEKLIKLIVVLLFQAWLTFQFKNK